MALSICMITRDAERNLPRVLTSVAPLEAEVVIGDTGSRDNTIEVARSLGARVVTIPWDDDFGAGQNYTLDRATGDWVLWLNPDEELVFPGPEQIQLLLDQEQAFAYIVRVQDLADPDQASQLMETWQPRLYRRHPDIRYQGRLHPQFVPPLDTLAHQLGKRVFRTDVLLKRHAYLSMLAPDKLRWATRLLERELQDRPEQMHYRIEYGRNLLLQNDPRGHDVLAEATRDMLAVHDAPEAPASNVVSLLEYHLTVSPEQSRSTITPGQIRDCIETWFPTSPPLLWLLAQGAFREGRLLDASRWLERIVDLGRTDTYDHSAPFDPSILGALPILNLGVCYLRLGDRDRAQKCFLEVLDDPNHGPTARRGLAEIANARGRQGEGR